MESNYACNITYDCAPFCELEVNPSGRIQSELTIECCWFIFSHSPLLTRLSDSSYLDINTYPIMGTAFAFLRVVHTRRRNHDIKIV